MRRAAALSIFSAVDLLAGAAFAQGAGAVAEEPPPPLTLGAYVEAYYQWNFNDPSNGITHYRGFDNRHDSFTLSNVALDAQWNHAAVIGRLTLQVGHTPSTYYLAEPALPGAAGANSTGTELWKYLQQAYAGYRFEAAGDLVVSAGLFLSPIGPEGMAVRDNWTWSRSNLFFGLPFYHTGLRVAYPSSPRWTLTLHAYNGWNSVVDSNPEKSLAWQLTGSLPGGVALGLLYFTGVERPAGAPEGRAWRHLADAHVTWEVTPRVALLAHVNGGFEQTRFGPSGWAAGALAARVGVADWLCLAGRGDAFYEEVASNAAGAASPIFWPVPWVASGTVTADFRPHERVSFRLEVRHDQAGGEMFFGGEVEGDGAAVPFRPNRAAQDTVTLGVTTWL